MPAACDERTPLLSSYMPFGAVSPPRRLVSALRHLANVAWISAELSIWLHLGARLLDVSSLQLRSLLLALDLAIIPGAFVAAALLGIARVLRPKSIDVSNATELLLLIRTAAVCALLGAPDARPMSVLFGIAQLAELAFALWRAHALELLSDHIFDSAVLSRPSAARLADMHTITTAIAAVPVLYAITSAHQVAPVTFFFLLLLVLILTAVLSMSSSVLDVAMMCGVVHAVEKDCHSDKDIGELDVLLQEVALQRVFSAALSTGVVAYTVADRGDNLPLAKFILIVVLPPLVSMAFEHSIRFQLCS